MSELWKANELRMVYEAAQPLLPVSQSAAFYAGMTGSLARSATQPPTYVDIALLLIPGLEALGIRAELLPLPESDAALKMMVRERLRRNVSLPVFAFSHEIAPPMSEQEHEEDTYAVQNSDAVTREENPTVTRRGRIIALEDEEFVWQNGSENEREQTSVSLLRSHFSHVLRLTRVRPSGSRRARLQAALLRWAAFAVAFPARTLTDSVPDAERRELAATFLEEVVGKARSPVATRLRHAAHFFAREQTDSAQAALRAALFLQLRLPAAAQRGMLSQTPLTDIERRELIYLARAGTRDLKVLAARRLAQERFVSDAARTLEQLAYDPDIRVRAAARFGSAPVA